MHPAKTWYIRTYDIGKIDGPSISLYIIIINIFSCKSSHHWVDLDWQNHGWRISTNVYVHYKFIYFVMTAN